MLRSILVGLDGSRHSRAAVDLGIRWARDFNTELVGMAVVDEPGIRGPEAMPIGGGHLKLERDDSMLRDARDAMAARAEQFANQCAAVPVQHRIVHEEASPNEALLQQAQCHDVVLLGQQSRFRSDEGESIFSTLPDLVKRGPRPLVAVPESLREGKSIVVAYDGGAPAARSLQALQSLGLTQGRPVYIVSVATELADAKAQAELAIAYLRQHEVSAEAVPVASSRYPVEIILERSIELEPHLLVLGPHGKSAWSEFFRGSVTHHMLGESAVPLFLFH